MKVLDSSTLMAVLFEEAGSENLDQLFLNDSIMSTVNLAEVQGKLVLRGLKQDEAWREASAHIMSIEPFTAPQAKLAGTLIAQTRPFGLSLGDRACLALAITLKAPVYTADQVWKDLKLPCMIHCIR